MQEKAPRLNSLIIQICKKYEIEAQKMSTSKTPQVALRVPQMQCRRRVLRITYSTLTSEAAARVGVRSTFPLHSI